MSTVRSCFDCKHATVGTRHFPSICRRYEADEDTPYAWARGRDKCPLRIEDARNGPCGKDARGFEEKPTAWRIVRSFLRGQA